MAPRWFPIWNFPVRSVCFTIFIPGIKPSFPQGSGPKLLGPGKFHGFPGFQSFYTLVNICTKCYWTWHLLRGFSHEKWWFSMAKCKRLPEGKGYSYGHQKSSDSSLKWWWMFWGIIPIPTWQQLVGGDWNHGILYDFPYGNNMQL